MSARYLGQVWDLDLDTTAKLLLAFLSDSADHVGVLPPMPTAVLASIIGRNPKTTNKALHRLEHCGLLIRNVPVWAVRLPTDTPQKDGPALDPEPERAPVDEPKPAETSKPDDAGEAAPIELSPADQRWIDFADAWGTDMSPTDAAAWQKLEQSEAKHNRKDKHKKDGEHWIVEVESMDELMPAILNAVACVQARLSAGLPVHAASVEEFIDKQLWLAPEYSGKPEAVTDVVEEIAEAELDDMVMKMNQKGGHFATHLRTTSKNPHTGEIETETLAIYTKRVLAKWDQYQATGAYFEE